MKSKWNLLFASAAIALLLSACGTDQSNGTPNDTTDDTPEVENGSSVENDGEDVEEPETDVQKENEEDVLKDAVPTASDAQNYTISVLPNYTLTSEEPGKDSLLADDNEAVFMRIETAPKEEGTYDYFTENLTAILEASSGGVAPTEVTDTTLIPSGEGIENAKVFSVQAESGPVTGIVFERGNMVVRLTIFDSSKEEHFNQFLKMSETIVEQS
ncbi:hypothetical protein ACFPRA_06925 [Sporosarcina soli]|uniref:Lipoprotein n=1 Tax=Sporosarcina soli TaxID=334736 RepID=A0ABW0TGV6_9BACL